MESYEKFLMHKNFINQEQGFEPLWMPDFLYDFQKELTEWSIRKGRAALFEDCGLGKTPQQLVWAQNIVKKTNGKVLLSTPLAVSYQTVKEAKKFGIDVWRTQDGNTKKGINITNYERLKKFDPKEFSGLVCDESSILKNFDGKTRRFITDFSKHIPYRLLCTATPAPNDFMELGTSAEALGMMTRSQMLGMFFTNDGKQAQQWNLKGHAKKKFWQWVSTWARAVRKPSDLGYDDNGFILPKLNIKQHSIKSNYKPKNGMLITHPAKTLNEQRAERNRTIKERCKYVKSLIPKDRPFLIWCHLNNEADLLEKMIDEAVQISGRDKDKMKEEKLIDFSSGNIRVLVTKPKIASFGLNWQHCSDMSFFPSHSHEQFYQASRRCWRFGQEREVNCHIVSSERESRVVNNMIRKERRANEMYNGIIREMHEFQTNNKKQKPKLIETEVPEWL